MREISIGGAILGAFKKLRSLTAKMLVWMRL